MACLKVNSLAGFLTIAYILVNFSAKRLTPASVITSSANGSPQMYVRVQQMYVVPTITSNAGGEQKVAFVNCKSVVGCTYKYRVYLLPSSYYSSKRFTDVSSEKTDLYHAYSSDCPVQRSESHQQTSGAAPSTYSSQFQLEVEIYTSQARADPQEDRYRNNIGMADAV